MSKKIEVRFLRWRADPADKITGALIPYYDDGWRVVSHAESYGDYTFVLERPAPNPERSTKP